MEIDIDLEGEQQPSLKQLQKYLYICTIVFWINCEHHLVKQLNKMQLYLPLLHKKPSITTTIKLKNSFEEYQAKRHPVVAVGGTFDYLHLGHQVLLLFTVLSAKDEVVIGITGQELLVKKKNKELIQHYLTRAKNVQEFIKSINPKLKISLYELKDPYGPTVEREDIDALVVSQETVVVCDKLNSIRLQRKYKGLQIVVCPTMSHSNQVQMKLSSSQIREYFLKKNQMKPEIFIKYRQYWQSLIDDYAKLIKHQLDEIEVEYWWTVIMKSYSEYWRFYHTNFHIYDCLLIWEKMELELEDRVALGLSIFFHDIIYLPQKSDNEEQSSKILTNFIKQTSMTQQPNLISKTTLIINETKAHQPSNNLSQLMYDIDMSILRSTQQKYKNYARKIRSQYEPLVGQSYYQKRIQFLTTLMKEKPYFSSGNLEAFYQNLQWQLYCLQNNDL